MTLHPKTKMCWSCEGSVPVRSDECPYCGVSLPTHDSGEPLAKGAIFIPPYQPSKAQELPPKQEAIAANSEKLLITDSKRYWQFFWTTTLLTAGLFFSLFGAMLLIFSGNDGYLTIQWNSSYWMLFLILGVPFLGVGLFLFNRLSDPS